MTAFDAFAKALKSTVLVVLLSLVWAAPASAHAGHGATGKAIARAVVALPQDARPAPVATERSSEAAGIGGLARSPAAAPSSDQQRDGSPGPTCCGTMCTVALIEGGAAPLPLHAPRGVRLALPPATLAPALAPGLPARPPRTSDIA